MREREREGGEKERERERERGGGRERERKGMKRNDKERKENKILKNLKLFLIFENKQLPVGAFDIYDL